MAEFLTTKGISYLIENIIIEAKNKLILVSPYLQISKTFFERLRDASGRNVAIKIIYGKDQLNKFERQQLAELVNVELFFCEHLHAKCYFNENKMVITSMNFFEFSEKNNREMGVLIDRKLDPIVFDKAVAETVSIIKSAELIPLDTKPERNRETNSKYLSSNKGYCIRCEKRIDLDPAEPYCGSCYSTWLQFANFDYEEKVCHKCGKPENSTMSKPTCYACYKGVRKNW